MQTNRLILCGGQRFGRRLSGPFHKYCPGWGVPCFGTPKHVFEYENMAPRLQGSMTSIVKQTTKEGRKAGKEEFFHSLFPAFLPSSFQPRGRPLRRLRATLATVARSI